MTHQIKDSHSNNNDDSGDESNNIYIYIISNKLKKAF